MVAPILVLTRERGTWWLPRKFRFPAYVNGLADGMLIEACAGLLDNQSPEEAIRREAEEELGVKVGEVHKVLETYTSPGSVTEKLFFFVADYDAPAGEVAGNSEEGDDIEVGERSEEYTSELQSHLNLVCRLLLEKKKKNIHVLYMC